MQMQVFTTLKSQFELAQIEEVEKNFSNFTISISHTTRKPRPNEIDGKDYKFVTVQEFNTLVKENSFFEHARIFDNYYMFANIHTLLFFFPIPYLSVLIPI